MRLTQYSVTHLACAAILTFIFASSVAAQATDTNSSEKKVAVTATKWEYCILTHDEFEYVSGGGVRRYAVIRYLRPNGVQKENFEYRRDSNGENRIDKDLLMTLMAKLGDEGWELVGEERMIWGNKDHPKFIFKRPKQ